MDPITSTIISSIISSAVQEVFNPAPPPPVYGIIRSLPIDAKVGMMAPPWEGQVQIDGQIYPLSPGAIIRNDLNMIVMPMFVQAPVKVRYTIDTTGAVNRVWILSAAEAYLPDNN